MYKRLQHFRFFIEKGLVASRKYGPREFLIRLCLFYLRSRTPQTILRVPDIKNRTLSSETFKVLFVSGVPGSTTALYRVHNIVEALSLAGVKATVVTKTDIRSEDINNLVDFDVVIFSRTFLTPVINQFFNVVKNLNIITVFEIDEDIVVRMTYSAKQEIRNPVFGVAIERSDGVLIEGPNTKIANYHIPLIHGNGCVDYNIHEVPLLPGSYYFTAAVYNEGCSVAYDHQERLCTFHIRSSASRLQRGLIKLKSSWSFDNQTDG